MLRDHGFGKVVDGHVGFRQVLVGAVLATDMGRHFPIVEELKRLASKWATSPEDDPNNTTDQLAAKVLITAGLIKCGDISNSVGLSLFSMPPVAYYQLIFPFPA
jgi:hypothetical protein